MGESTRGREAVTGIWDRPKGVPRETKLMQIVIGYVRQLARESLVNKNRGPIETALCDAYARMTPEETAALPHRAYIACQEARWSVSYRRLAQKPSDKNILPLSIALGIALIAAIGTAATNKQEIVLNTIQGKISGAMNRMEGLLPKMNPPRQPD
jgi:hypothetical protein